MDYYSAIRINALEAVLSGDSQEYIFRHILRWYSKNFYTPLHVVETIPLEDVLTAYYESKYEEMKDIELDMEKSSLLETDEEKAMRLRKEDEDKAIESDLMSKKEMINKLFKVEKKKNKLPGLGQMTEQILDLSSVVSGDKKDSSILAERPYKMREPILPSPNDIPEISMRFLADDEELPLDMDPMAFGLLKTPGSDDNLP